MMFSKIVKGWESEKPRTTEEEKAANELKNAAIKDIEWCLVHIASIEKTKHNTNFVTLYATMHSDIVTMIRDAQTRYPLDKEMKKVDKGWDLSLNELFGIFQRVLEKVYVQKIHYGEVNLLCHAERILQRLSSILTKAYHYKQDQNFEKELSAEAVKVFDKLFSSESTKDKDCPLEAIQAVRERLVKFGSRSLDPEAEQKRQIIRICKKEALRKIRNAMSQHQANDYETLQSQEPMEKAEKLK